METESARVKTVVSDDEMIFVALRDGSIRCSAIVFDCEEIAVKLDESFDQLAQHQDSHCENDEVLSLRFKPYALLDYLVEGHAINGNRKQLDEIAKPCIEQLRKELQAMVDEIDGLSYLST